MKKTRYLLLILALAAASCSRETEEPVFAYTMKSARVIRSNNQFGLDLLRTVLSTEEKDNVLISPASVGIALGMTYNGAETSTRQAFERVLDYEGLTRQEINEITGELIEVLTTNAKGNVLDLANSIWTDEGFPVEEEFLSLNDTYFDAQVSEIDLQSEWALETINNWVSDHTHGKIDGILETINRETVMILINAIYFKCLWELEFDPEDTREAPFYNDQGVVEGEVEMMNLEGTFRWAATEEFTAVELPYRNSKFSMFVFLPGQGSGVEDLIADLDGQTWQDWLDQFSSQEDFRVSLPKFRFEYQRSLSEDLKEMGLEIAFGGSADFSSMTPEPVFISDVIHRTFIDVNEKGTEAAAATAVTIDRSSVSLYGIEVNRPFLFAITENSSRSIVFVGKVSDPEYGD